MTKILTAYHTILIHFGSTPGQIAPPKIPMAGPNHPGILPKHTLRWMVPVFRFFEYVNFERKEQKINPTS